MQRYDPGAQTRIALPPIAPRRRRRGLLRNAATGCLLGVGLWVAFIVTIFLGTTLAYVISPPPTTNILILGTDTRPGSDEDRIARTDSIMILNINGRDGHVSLLSIPRDVFLESPRYGWLRANTVIRNAELNSEGSGIEEMQATIENTFGFEVHHSVRVNFEGFEDTIDALGGITVDVPKRIVDNAYPTADYGTMRIEFQPGWQTLDGENALIYARTRHADDDYQRASRQQQVMSAIISKAINPLNWYRLPAVGVAINRNFDTDMNLFEMIRHSPGIMLYGRGSDQIEQLVLDRNYITYGSGGEAYPNQARIQPWLDEHLN